MALSSSSSLRYPISSTPIPTSATVRPNLPVLRRSPGISQRSSFHLCSKSINGGRRTPHHLINATEEQRQGNESEATSTPQNSSLSEPESEDSSSSDLSELSSEIKNAMKEKKEREGEGDLWSGVAEEIKEIEWPAFGKVLGTTGVVLGVIAGSSVVLLTVNAVLAELSDRAFAGKGVQDFFS